MLGLDALSSAAYGPEAALTLLLPLGAAGPRYIGPLTLVILAVLAVLYVSYRQTISAYPTGGGSYTVAKENLGVRLGLLAAAALLLDYILNVAVGNSAGGGRAGFGDTPAASRYSSALSGHPHAHHPRQSSRSAGVGPGLCAAHLSVPGDTRRNARIRPLQVAGVRRPPRSSRPSGPLSHAAAAVSLWLLLRAFVSGCTAMTGVEAVSNGVTAFADPAQERAKRTLGFIVLFLALLLGGIAYLCRAYGIGAAHPDSPAYQSVIFQIVGAVAGRGAFYYVTLGSVLAVLSLRQHQVRGLPAPLPAYRRGRLPAPRLRKPWAPAGLHHRHRDPVRPLRLASHPLRRHHGPPDSSFRGWRIPRVHALPGGDGHFAKLLKVVYVAGPASLCFINKEDEDPRGPVPGPSELSLRRSEVQRLSSGGRTGSCVYM